MPATPDEPGRALAALEPEVIGLDPLQQPLLRVQHQPGPRHSQLVLVRPEHSISTPPSTTI